MTAVPASPSWSVWWVCILLLFATTINYMDRVTLATISQRITNEFKLSDEQYGYIESAFALSFATGSLIFGFVADRTNIRWLYPIVLLLWSLMGFLTGFVETFAGLLLCRAFLGLFEAGHWPCGLKTTFLLLPPKNRALGNSVLQSGTAIGSIVTPLIMRFTMSDAPGSWRPVFQCIGAIGVVWVVAWLLSTNTKDLAPVARQDDSAQEFTSPTSGADTLANAFFSRKFFVLLVMVISINACWQLLRVWMPKFLQVGRGYEEATMLLIMPCYYFATDVGCLAAGFLTRFLHGRGYTVHSSRMIVYGICTLMVAFGGLIPWLPAGPGLMVVLCLVAMGSLGLFPCYYSFSQELSARHLGIVTGSLGTIAWIASSPLHPIVGKLADRTKSYDLGLSLACGLPMIAFVALVLVWPRHTSESPVQPVNS